MSKLTNRPEGNTYKERLVRHLERERLAKPWLRLLVEGLHVLLLCSIGLFVSGLLYQLWNLGGSFKENVPRLLITWGLGIFLSLSILSVVLGASMHALIHEASPFGGPFSRTLFMATRKMAGSFESWMKQVEGVAGWLDDRFKYRRRPFRKVLRILGQMIAAPLWLSFQLVNVWRVELRLNADQKLWTAYMDLIAEASDPKLLERAVGSFSYVEWVWSQGQSQGSVDRLKKTWNRLTATDTSIRVRETLRSRIFPFVKHCAENNVNISEDVMHSIIKSYTFSTHFSAEVLSASFDADNADLRPFAALPFEKCIAHILCSYSHPGKLGDRERIFDLAQEHCHDLEGKGVDVTRIFSHVNPLNLIKSFIQFPGVISYRLVRLIVKDHKLEILRQINEFITTVDQSRLGPDSISWVFLALADPPPTTIDLSPLIDYLSRHPYRWTWEHTSTLIMSYLTSYPLSKLSDRTAIRQFLNRHVDAEFCDEHGYRYLTSAQARAQARILLAGE